MAARMIHFPRPVLPPGLLSGLLLSMVQSLLVALVPADFNTVFVLLILLILLLYLLVPLFARLHTMRKGEQAPGDKSVARRIGLTCASLVTISTIVVYTLSTSGVRVAESGGFLDFRLGVDSLFSLVALILLNAVGLALSLIGGWLGGVFGTIWVHTPEEQRL